MGISAFVCNMLYRSFVGYGDLVCPMYYVIQILCRVWRSGLSYVICYTDPL